jgi:hypothetical protein
MATSKIQFKYDIDSKDVSIASDRVLTLKQESKAFYAELQRLSAAGQENSVQFEILSKKYNETNDNLSRVNAKSRELFSTFSLLPGPIGDIAGGLDNSIGLLKTFSGFSLKDISTQFGGLVDDLGEIALNILGLNKANKTLAATTKEVAVAQEGAAVATEVNTVATEGLTVAEEGATVAAKGLGAALKAIGIGLIIAAVATLIAYWDELKDAIMGTSDVTRAYDEAQKEVTKSVADFNTKLFEVQNALKAAENGTMSKEKALKIYNDKLGETVGYAGSLEQAESLIASNTTTVIEGIKLRAQAQIFYAKSAELAAKAISGEGIDPSWWQTTANFVKSGGNLFSFAGKQAETIAENYGEILETSKKFAAEGDKLTKQEIENNKNLKKGLAKPPEPPKAKTSTGKDPAVQAKEQSLKEIQKLEQEGFMNSLSAREKEEYMVNQKYSKAIYDAIKYGQDTANLKDLQGRELAKIAKKYDDEDFKKQIERTRSANQQKLAQADTLYERMKNKYGEDSKEAIKALNDKFDAEVKVYQDELTALNDKVKAGGVLTDEEIRKQGELALAIGKVATAREVSEGKTADKVSKDKMKDIEDEIKLLDKLLESEGISAEQKLNILDEENTKEQEAYEAQLVAAGENNAKKEEIEKAHTEFLREQAQKRVDIEATGIEERKNLLTSYADFVGQIGSIISGIAGENKQLAIAGIIIEQGAALAKVFIDRSATISKALLAAAPLLINPLTAAYGQAQLTKVTLQANLTAGISAAGIIAGAAKGIAEINKANTGGSGGQQAPSGGNEQPRRLARGGMVTGPGSSTSDSIPAMLSTGESVINAASTAMFAPLLSTINQMGGGARFAEGGIAPYSSIDSSQPFASAQGEQPMIKAYVVAQDMTSQQMLDRNTKSRSTL